MVQGEFGGTAIRLAPYQPQVSRRLLERFALKEIILKKSRSPWLHNPKWNANCKMARHPINRSHE
jgi:hypothetical protein